jgi:hypothetical protein|tara:strand:+ start:3649 stop:3843 length:195 start_codon:yes stop_codon:yes gene_type:complete
MKVGDAVIRIANGQIGIILEKHSRAEPDGNPNGDFTISYIYKVLLDDAVYFLPSRCWEVISASR